MRSNYPLYWNWDLKTWSIFHFHLAYGVYSLFLVCKFHWFLQWALKFIVIFSSNQVNKRCRFLLEFEQEVKNALKNLKPSEHPFGGQDVDASSLGWAMSAVSSRAFRLYGKKLPDGTHSDIPMMLPLIDMCNHSFNPNARILQEQDAGNPNMLIKAGSCKCFLLY